jgi:type I restriction enzyme M protein
VLKRWEARDGSERGQPRTAQSFCVPKTEIAATGYDLSLNRYKETEHEEQRHAAPATLIRELRSLEAEIAGGIQKLEAMLQ